MERFILSKIEWLTEWFMQLFFDPMYFYQPEVIHTDSEISGSVKAKLLNRQRSSFSFRRLYSLFLDVIDFYKVRIRRFSDVLFISKIHVRKKASWLNVSVSTVVEKIKSTLNKVQSAVNILRNELSLGF